MDVYDAHDEETREAALSRRHPYVGVLFECCGVYTRVYRRPDQQVYEGRCPRCLRRVRLRVGPEGTRARLFRAE